MKNILGIKKLVKENENFRKVVFTGKQAQVVVMNLMPGDEIGEETHPAIDQLFFVTDGRGEVELDGKATPVEEDDLAIVPAGTRHNFRNTGKKPLKVVTVYGSPVHAPEAVQRFARKLVEKA